MIIALPPYINGIFYSFGFLLALGPAFFYLLSLSITKGFRSGAMFAAGIVVSDLVIMAVIYFGFGKYFDNENFKAGFSLIGGVILVLMGVKFLIEKDLNIERGEDLVEESLVGHSLKGFLMNISNPFAFIIWLTIKGTVISAHPDYEHLDYMLFFAGLFGMLFIMEITKAFLADKIGKFLTTKILLIMHKLLGIVFVCIGIFLFYEFCEVLMC